MGESRVRCHLQGILYSLITPPIEIVTYSSADQLEHNLGLQPYFLSRFSQFAALPNHFVCAVLRRSGTGSSSFSMSSFTFSKFMFVQGGTAEGAYFAAVPSPHTLTDDLLPNHPSMPIDEPQENTKKYSMGKKKIIIEELFSVSVHSEMLELFELGQYQELHVPTQLVVKHRYLTSLKQQMHVSSVNEHTLILL